MLTHDEQTDAVYVRLQEGVVARTDEFSESMTVDYDAAGSPLGVEILDASDGVDLGRLPTDIEYRVGRILEEHSFRVLAH